MSNVEEFRVENSSDVWYVYYGDKIIFEGDEHTGITFFLNTVIKPWMERKSKEFAQHLQLIEEEQKNDIYQLRKDYEARIAGCEEDLEVAEATIDALKIELKILKAKKSYGIGVQL